MAIRTVSELRQQFGWPVPRRLVSRIDGRGVKPNGTASLLPIIYPASEEQVSCLQQADAGEVDAAVAAARRAFERGPWPRMATPERQEILRLAQGLMVEHQQELAFLECLCAGLPIRHLQTRQVPRAAENFGFFAEYIGQIAGEVFEQLPGFLTTVTRQPAGVAALFTPWNAPLALSTMRVAACIAFGNTCVLKPSEYVPLAIGRMVELLEQAGVPPGVVNVVNGKGSITGHDLVGHRGIDRVSFTGTTDAAKQIMTAAAANLTAVHLSLGGKSANIVFADADLEQAVDGSLVNVFSNNGQICVAGSRILVQRGIADDFIAAFVQGVGNLRIGDPMDTSTEIGPLAFEAHYNRVLSYFDLAVREGAELLLGGGRAQGFERGYFLQPTVVRVNSNALRVCQEEVFGPFVTIQVFDEDDEALAIANDSDYGLVSYIWTQSLQRSLMMQQRIEAGTLWVNTSLARDLRAPFGGFKNSGIGRDGPRHCADFFTEEKATIVARGGPGSSA